MHVNQKDIKKNHLHELSKFQILLYPFFQMINTENCFLCKYAYSSHNFINFIYLCLISLNLLGDIGSSDKFQVYNSILHQLCATITTQRQVSFCHHIFNLLYFLLLPLTTFPAGNLHTVVYKFFCMFFLFVRLLISVYPTYK